MAWSKKSASSSGGAAESDRLAAEVARLPREVTTAISFHLREQGISRSELASRMGVSPGRVSQILSGDENLTLHTLAAVCAALRVHFRLELVPDQPAGHAPVASPLGSAAVSVSRTRRAG